MRKIAKETTIAAISTPIGEGGIGIVRLSGPEAISIADSVFVNPRGRRLKDTANRSMVYGFIKDKNTGKDIDEVLVSVMRGPHSYTGEDVVEINCHGGILPVRKVLEAVIANGAMLAGPGEFTKRAFMNGRIDLAQAEAVIDIITAKTDVALSNSLVQLEGELSQRIMAIRDNLMDELSHIEALVDYPDEDVDQMDMPSLSSRLTVCQNDIKQLLATADIGRVMRDGLKTSIIGKPNVGKSSLLNALSRADRAIVTDIPGTTRDIIEEFVNIKGILLDIIDTAGIRETADEVERIGVDKTLKAAAEADLVILMFDASQPLSKDDEDIIKIVASKQVIAVLNKCDLGITLSIDDVKAKLPDATTVMMSLKNGYGLDTLENVIADMVYQGKAIVSGQAIVTNVRHKEALIRADKALERALKAIADNVPVDLISIDLKEAIEALGTISGQTIEEEIVDRIFQRFCVGK